MTSQDPYVVLGFLLAGAVLLLVVACASVAEYRERRRIGALLSQEKRAEIWRLAEQQRRSWERNGFR